jgi:hypothetical protein
MNKSKLQQLGPVDQWTINPAVNKRKACWVNLLVHWAQPLRIYGSGLILFHIFHAWLGRFLNWSGLYPHVRPNSSMKGKRITAHLIHTINSHSPSLFSFKDYCRPLRLDQGHGGLIRARINPTWPPLGPWSHESQDGSLLPFRWAEPR